MRRTGVAGVTSVRPANGWPINDATRLLRALAGDFPLMAGPFLHDIKFQRDAGMATQPGPTRCQPCPTLESVSLVIRHRRVSWWTASFPTRGARIVLVAGMATPE